MHVLIYIYILMFCSVGLGWVGLGSQSAGRIKAIFAEIDSDNSGTIDQGEFARAMKILRVDLTSREIQEVSFCLYVCTVVYVNGVCLYICMYVHWPASVCVCMYVCMYVSE